jgi:hypothetical protein
MAVCAFAVFIIVKKNAVIKLEVESNFIWEGFSILFETIFNRKRLTMATQNKKLNPPTPQVGPTPKALN